MRTSIRAGAVGAMCVACLAVTPIASASSTPPPPKATFAVTLKGLLPPSLANQLASPLNQLSGAAVAATGTVASQLNSGLNQLTGISSTSGLGLDPTLQAAGTLVSAAPSTVALVTTFLGLQSPPTDPPDYPED